MFLLERDWEKIRLEKGKILTVLVRKLLVWPHCKKARKLNHACLVTSAALLLSKNFSNDKKLLMNSMNLVDYIGIHNVISNNRLQGLSTMHFQPFFADSSIIYFEKIIRDF